MKWIWNDKADAWECGKWSIGKLVTDDGTEYALVEYNGTDRRYLKWFGTFAEAKAEALRLDTLAMVESLAQ